MVEVFKTDVREQAQADWLVALIHQRFLDCTANFDLEDCDRILRIASKSGSIAPSCLIRLLEDSGYQAEVLPDTI